MDASKFDRTLCYGIAEFCRDARICRTKLYALLKEGQGPQTIKIGHRRLILVDSAQRWLRKLELATEIHAADPARRTIARGTRS